MNIPSKSTVLALSLLPLAALQAKDKMQVESPSNQADIAKYVLNQDAPKPYGTTPTPQQVDWQRLEFYGFIHFGINTFTGREWGYGNDGAELFNPTKFDADKIIKTFKDGGFKGMIYTAKHHDGWCAWPTKTTKHSIEASPYKKGKGDIVGEFARACQKHDIKFGTYLSPWDRNHADYGKDGYIKDYYSQIEELLSNYGPVFEIWFDGANGGDGYYGGKKDYRNIGNAEKYYNFEQIVKNIRKMQPDCIIWGAGSHGDAQWGGSETGMVKYPQSHTIPGPNGSTRWVPNEGDTPINTAGWFWHKGQENTVKSTLELMDVWFSCVGRGANLILNLAVDDKGQLEKVDAEALLEFKKLRDQLYKTDYALGATLSKVSNIRKDNKKLFGGELLFDDNIESYWSTDNGITTGEIEAKLKTPAVIDVVRIREQIRLGQRVQAWELDIKVNGQWKLATKGLSIGNQILFTFANKEPVSDIRLRITKSKDIPTISEISLFKMPPIVIAPSLGKNAAGLVEIGNKKASSGHHKSGIFVLGHLLDEVGKGKVVYTIDGSAPTKGSPVYSAPFDLPQGGVVSAARIGEDGSLSPISRASFGISKKGWKIVQAPKGSNAMAAIDDDNKTFWHTHAEGGQMAPPQSFTVDMGADIDVDGFKYMPRQDGTPNGMTSRYIFEVSLDGKKFTRAAAGEFGNLRANPIEQTIRFKTQKARYFRFIGTKALEKNHVSCAEISILTPNEKK